MGRKALQEYFDGIADKKDVEALSEILLGWKGVEAEFSPEALGETSGLLPVCWWFLLRGLPQGSFDAKEKLRGGSPGLVRTRAY